MTRPERARRLDGRVALLQQVFEHVRRTRMADVPICNPRLHVEAVGFAVTEEDAALGVLITPWFMNLIWLPLDDVAPFAPLAATAGRARAADLWPVGQTRSRELGTERFEFIGAHDDRLGSYGLCSLFSPMFEFASQAVARATAQAVLSALRPAAGERSPATATAPGAPSRPCATVPPGAPFDGQPARVALRPVAGGAGRRGFLLGRGAATGR